jgi:hypothetical protein
VIGANMQGATIMSETMSQYSALMVMEREYGRELMRRFLKYELDQYLAGRGGERIEELPLLRVENQPYIHYRKGSLVMYRLREMVGEDSLNAALARYVERVGFQLAPWTTSLEFLDAIRAAAPDRPQLFEDLFETITLWDMRARSATATPLPDGRWRVRLALDLRKLRATGEGEESPIPFDDSVQVGVFGAEVVGGPAHGTPLHREYRRLTAADSIVEIVVEGEPRMPPWSRAAWDDPASPAPAISASMSTAAVSASATSPSTGATRSPSTGRPARLSRAKSRPSNLSCLPSSRR